MAHISVGLVGEVEEMRILWKYINKRTRDVYFSWVRWDRGDAYGFWEFRLPPEEEE